MGQSSASRRPAKPKPGAHVSEPAADSGASARAAYDSVSWTGSDATAAAFAAAQSSAMTAGLR